MAAGDRKVKVMQFRIERGIPIMCDARWVFEVENKLASDMATLLSGGVRFQLAATLAAFNAMTGSQIRTAIVNAVTADSGTPANDGVTA